MPSWEMVEQGFTSLAADILFGVIVLGGFGLLILVVMFFLLAVRALFNAGRRWLTGHTWNGVIASLEAKAFHGRVPK